MLITGINVNNAVSSVEKLLMNIINLNNGETIFSSECTNN